MLMAAAYLAYPLLIINKYVFCKLTNRPFIWLNTYTADLLTLACYLYAFSWHVVWMNVENSGLGLEENPSKDLMYVEAYGLHAQTFEFNVQFYIGICLLLSFGR